MTEITLHPMIFFSEKNVPQTSYVKVIDIDASRRLYAITSILVGIEAPQSAKTRL